MVNRVSGRAWWWLVSLLISVVRVSPNAWGAAELVAADRGTVTVETLRSPTLGEDLRYRIYLPAKYERSLPDERFAVVYLLHGRGDSMDAWEPAIAELDRLIAEHRVPPLIAVMPDCPSSQRAGYYIDSQHREGKAVETALVRELIPAIDEKYRTNRERSSRLIAGYSMGGYGALRLSLAYPERFGGAVVLSPAVYVPLPPRSSSTREFGAFGQGGDLFSDEIYREKNYPAMLPKFHRANLRLTMFIAVGDDERPADADEAVHDLDYEAHTLYNRVRREPLITAQLRVVDGGHNWGVWRPMLAEGLVYVFSQLQSVSATDRGKP